MADTLEVRRWILGYGPDAEVVEPGGLREALRQEAEALARMLTPVRIPAAPVKLELSPAAMGPGLVATTIWPVALTLLTCKVNTNRPPSIAAVGRPGRGALGLGPVAPHGNGTD